MRGSGRAGRRLVHVALALAVTHQLDPARPRRRRQRRNQCSVAATLQLLVLELTGGGGKLRPTGTAIGAGARGGDGAGRRACPRSSGMESVVVAAVDEGRR
jgi:hypothetical protein